MPTENTNKANQIPQDVSEEIFVLSDNDLGFCDKNSNEFICNTEAVIKIKWLCWKEAAHSFLKSNQKFKRQEKKPIMNSQISDLITKAYNSESKLW